MIDVAAVRSYPVLVIPSSAIEVVDVDRVVVNVVESVDEILVPVRDIVMAARRPAFTRAALSRSHPRIPFAGAALSRL